MVSIKKCVCCNDYKFMKCSFCDECAALLQIMFGYANYSKAKTYLKYLATWDKYYYLNN